AESAEQRGGPPVGGAVAGAQGEVVGLDAGAHRAVPAAQGVQSVVFVVQQSGEGGQGPLAAGEQSSARDPQGQRLVVAQPCDPLRGLGFGADPPGAAERGQQPDRLGRRQRAEADVPDAVQGASPHAAGDQRRRLRPGGEQRTDLRLVHGVVQNDQEATPFGEFPEPVGALLGVGGDLLGGQAEAAEQAAQGVGGGAGSAAASAAEVDVELAVRIVLGERGGGLERQRRLAAAAGAVHGDDGGACAGVRPGAQRLLQDVQFGGPADERGGGGREQAGRGAARGQPDGRRFLLQQPGVTV